MFGNDDESDASDDEQNDTHGAPMKVGGGSLREEGPCGESNEGSSVRGAAASVTNGGRPQRKTKSKNFSSQIPAFNPARFYKSVG